MRSFFAVLLAVSLTTIHAASIGPPAARDASLTNAERLARGMALLKPRKLFESSRTLTARTGTPSSTAPGTISRGTISVYTADTDTTDTGGVTHRKRSGTFLGYLDNVAALQSTYSWRNQFAYTVPTDPNTPVIVRAPEYYGTLPENGFIMTPGVFGGWLDGTNPDGSLIYHSYDVVPGSSNYIRFASVYGAITPLADGGPAGSPAVYDSTTSQWEEYAVWQIAPDTGVATLKWQNLDGSYPELTLCVATDPTYGNRHIIATVDLDATTAALANPGIYYDAQTISDCGLTIVFDTGVPTATT
ncbi:hypothetical protein B0H11DRAFT_2050206 [Mycena galericulata]|nr:hypothetical protein B0H11DRAFT_2050206 [Mycena galericulata]